jgi:hypothetical protein
MENFKNSFDLRGNQTTDNDIDANDSFHQGPDFVMSSVGFEKDEPDSGVGGWAIDSGQETPQNSGRYLIETLNNSKD